MTSQLSKDVMEAPTQDKQCSSCGRKRGEAAEADFRTPCRKCDPRRVPKGVHQQSIAPRRLSADADSPSSSGSSIASDTVPSARLPHASEQKKPQSSNAPAVLGPPQPMATGTDTSEESQEGSTNTAEQKLDFMELKHAPVEARRVFKKAHVPGEQQPQGASSRSHSVSVPQGVKAVPVQVQSSRLPAPDDQQLKHSMPKNMGITESQTSINVPNLSNIRKPTAQFVPPEQGYQRLVQENQPLAQGYQPLVQDNQPLVQGNLPLAKGNEPIVPGYQPRVPQYQPPFQRIQGGMVPPPFTVGNGIQATQQGPNVQNAATVPRQRLVQENQPLVQDNQPLVQGNIPLAKGNEPIVPGYQPRVPQYQPPFQRRQGGMVPPPFTVGNGMQATQQGPTVQNAAPVPHQMVYSGDPDRWLTPYGADICYNCCFKRVLNQPAAPTVPHITPGDPYSWLAPYGADICYNCCFKRVSYQPAAQTPVVPQLQQQPPVSSVPHNSPTLSELFDSLQSVTICGGEGFGRGRGRGRGGVNEKLVRDKRMDKVERWLSLCNDTHNRSPIQEPALAQSLQQQPVGQAPTVPQLQQQPPVTAVPHNTVTSSEQLERWYSLCNNTYNSPPIQSAALAQSLQQQPVAQVPTVPQLQQQPPVPDEPVPDERHITSSELVARWLALCNNTYNSPPIQAAALAQSLQQQPVAPVPTVPQLQQQPPVPTVPHNTITSSELLGELLGSLRVDPPKTFELPESLQSGTLEGREGFGTGRRGSATKEILVLSRESGNDKWDILANNKYNSPPIQAAALAQSLQQQPVAPVPAGPQLQQQPAVPAQLVESLQLARHSEIPGSINSSANSSPKNVRFPDPLAPNQQQYSNAPAVSGPPQFTATGPAVDVRMPDASEQRQQQSTNTTEAIPRRAVATRDFQNSQQRAANSIQIPAQLSSDTRGYSSYRPPQSARQFMSLGYLPDDYRRKRRLAELRRELLQDNDLLTADDDVFSSLPVIILQKSPAKKRNEGSPATSPEAESPQPQPQQASETGGSQSVSAEASQSSGNQTSGTARESQGPEEDRGGLRGRRGAAAASGASGCDC